ncbi:MAG TPA: carboxylating nicotinate-nucleotide diphosphorylase [bacterium]|nr:carboxylating nicotinate-nucleotide diphosphorylase [bacterium]
MKPWNTPAFVNLLNLAIAEDLQTGDSTSESLIPEDAHCNAHIRAKSDCIVSGQAVAEIVFHRIDPSIRFEASISDGNAAKSGTIVSRLNGNTRSILAGERLALNFMQRMSGIATMTHQMVNRIAGTRCRVIDTRKTVPGHRYLDKYAVRCGGGGNHRMNLGDGVLIKDNHIEAAGSVKTAVIHAMAHTRHTLRIQVEVTSLETAREAVGAGAGALLLDNMEPDEIRRIVMDLPEHVLCECSGNITLETIRAYAETGVHLISVGALTHSVQAADLSLQIIR